VAGAGAAAWAVAGAEGEGAAVVAVAAVAGAGIVTAAIAAVVAVGTAAGNRAILSGIQFSNRGVHYAGSPVFCASVCPALILRKTFVPATYCTYGNKH
jgi:hypothetical protein